MSSNQQDLEVAILEGDAVQVEVLLNNYPDLLDRPFEDNVGLTPLMWACRNRRDSIVENLLARGANPHIANLRDASGDGGNSALWFTSQGEAEGTVQIARMLLDQGADINAPGEHGMTAFYMAASWLHLDLMQYLASRGADIELPDSNGRTPLEMMRQGLAWCAGQEIRNEMQAKFAERGPRIVRYLERIAS